VVGFAGKDYLTVREAAAYAGISFSHWRARVQREFPAGEFCAKLLYRRADVQRYIEQNTRWPRASDDRFLPRTSMIARAKAVPAPNPLRAPGSHRLGRRPKPEPMTPKEIDNAALRNAYTVRR